MAESLREEIDATLEAGDMMLNPPEDLGGFIDKEAVKKSRTEQILSLVIERVEQIECPWEEWEAMACEQKTREWLVFHEAIQAMIRELKR